jgi:hypothetical protein
MVSTFVTGSALGTAVAVVVVVVGDGAAAVVVVVVGDGAAAVVVVVVGDGAAAVVVVVVGDGAAAVVVVVGASPTRVRRCCPNGGSRLCRDRS